MSILVGNTVCLPPSWTARARPCVPLDAHILNGFRSTTVGNFRRVVSVEADPALRY